jgi:hypothetical protein
VARNCKVKLLDHVSPAWGFRALFNSRFEKLDPKTPDQVKVPSITSWKAIRRLSGSS